MGNDDKLTPYITIVVLITGVAGGLVLVISVILFCKYCITRKKELKRRPVLFKRTSPDRLHRPYLQYESLESSGSPEASSSGLYKNRASAAAYSKVCSAASSVSGAGSSTGVPSAGSGSTVIPNTNGNIGNATKTKFTIKNSKNSDVDEEESIDVLVARYKSQKADEEQTNDDLEAAALITPPNQEVQIQVEGEEVARGLYKPEPQSHLSPHSSRHKRKSSSSHAEETTTPSSTNVPTIGSDPKHVCNTSKGSFTPPVTTPVLSPLASKGNKSPGQCGTSTRYTETDFHHLKLLKVEKPLHTSKITKQRSWGHPVQDRRERCVVQPLSRSMDAPPSGGFMPNRQYLEDYVKPRHNDKLSRDLDRPIRRHLDDSPSSPHGLPTPQIISAEVHHDASHSHHLKSLSISGGGNSGMFNTGYTSGKSLPVRPDNAAMRRASYSSACRRDTLSSVSRYAPNYSSQSAINTFKYPELFNRPSSPPKALEVQSYRRRIEERRHSHSLEIAPSRLMVPSETRRVRSFEGELHQMYDYRAPPPPMPQVYNASYERMSDKEGSQELQSKVRYNDTGSFEEVNDDMDFFLDEIEVESLVIDVGEGTTSDETSDTVSAPQKYREIWNLRATLEEEEDFSDTIRMEDMTSPEDHSEDQERDRTSTSHTTSFESNTEPVPSNEHSPTNPLLAGVHGSSVKTGSDTLLHPNYENRRHTYRSILNKSDSQTKHRLNPATRKGDNSFDSVDSVDTIDTNGGSDTSRPEVTSTSFESTTDNTDSTGDGQMHRLQQMRGDSGYKSLEKQQTVPTPNYQQGLAPPGQKKHIQFKIEDGNTYEYDVTPGLVPTPSSDDGSQIHMATHVGYSPTEEEKENYTQKSTVILHFERRSAKTASRKRRDYKKERRAIQRTVYDAETDSRSDHLSGDSFEENHQTPKLSVFSRFISRSQSREHRHHNQQNHHHHHHHHHHQQLSRDYSIDSKTDAIFNEFLRFDPALESKSLSARVRQRNRLNRKHTEPSMDIERQRRLVPEMRSASVGSDSSNEANRKRLSMQSSIDDDYIENHNNARNQALTHRHTQQAGHIHDNIPMIRLPEDDHPSEPRLIYETMAH